MAENCAHLNQIKPVKPKTKGCEECLKMGDMSGRKSRAKTGCGVTSMS